VAIWLAGSALAVTVAVLAIGLAGARVTGQGAMVRASDRTLATIIDPLTIDATTMPLAADNAVVGPTADRPLPVPAAPDAPHADGRSSTPTLATDSAAQPTNDGPTQATTTTTTAPTTPPPSPSSTKSITVTGGTVKVQCINASVSLVSAVPAAGFGVEVGNRGPNQVEVQFHTSVQESQVSASCRAGVITFTKEEGGG